MALDFDLPAGVNVPYWIDSNFSRSFGSMINHSCNPNCIVYRTVDEIGYPHLDVYAIKDICKEEPISINYFGNKMTWDDLDGYCKCGATRCKFREPQNKIN